MNAGIKKVGSVRYPFVRAETMVIASDNASLGMAYRNLIEEKLAVRDYFFYRNKDVIDSLAFNYNKDRPYSISMIKRNLDCGVRKILLVTHVDYSDCKDKTAQEGKFNRKVSAAQGAIRAILNQFKGQFGNLTVEGYIIVMKGELKVFHQILELEKSVSAGATQIPQ
ncbi:hypothetical protein IPM19_04000 [bacterium]|nr:MAG: hypothetical protein IPM19_04000 [bacterium]